MRQEIILSFRILSRKYHSDKWHTRLPFGKDEGTEKFKEIANARDLLLEMN